MGRGRRLGDLGSNRRGVAVHGQLQAAPPPNRSRFDVFFFKIS